jgi:hypothetical protein
MVVSQFGILIGFFLFFMFLQMLFVRPALSSVQSILYLHADDTSPDRAPQQWCKYMALQAEIPRLIIDRNSPVTCLSWYSRKKIRN